MAASYPTGLDTMSDPGANLSGPPLHATMHTQINDVIEAMQSELGLSPSAGDATVTARLARLDGMRPFASMASTSVTAIAGTEKALGAVSANFDVIGGREYNVRTIVPLWWGTGVSASASSTLYADGVGIASGTTSRLFEGNERFDLIAEVLWTPSTNKNVQFTMYVTGTAGSTMQTNCSATTRLYGYVLTPLV